MIKKLLPFFLVLLCFELTAQEESWFQKNFRSKEDGAIDLSQYLNTKVGIMPMPIIITEPAVGYGGGLNLIYFHKRKTLPNGELAKGFPSISMVAAAYTENKTFIALAAHQGSYVNDFLRYTGAIGTPNINLKFYGGSALGERLGLDFNLKGFIFFQEFLTRVNKELPLFLGFNYIYFGNETKFNLNLPIDDLTAQTNTAGINFVTTFDTRDNIFTPNNGGFAALDFGIHDKALGGDRNYNNVAFRGYYYMDQVKRTVFGFKYNLHYKWGDIPFFELPFVSLRGIPALRYQGNLVNNFEIEARYQIHNRWSIMGFTGLGIASENFADINKDSYVTTIGTGFRYELAREYGLHVGLDFAWGPEQFAWYITFGSAWFR